MAKKAIRFIIGLGSTKQRIGTVDAKTASAAKNQAVTKFKLTKEQAETLIVIEELSVLQANGFEDRNAWKQAIIRHEGGDY